MALEFLNKAGVNQFSTEFLKTVNSKIESYISTATVTASSDDDVVASAKATADVIKKSIEAQVHLTFETVTGAISGVTTPDTSKIYLQKDSDQDPTWTLYVYKDNGWIAIGDASIDLQNYYSKSDVDDMLESLDINEFSSAFEALKATVEEHLKATNISTTDITAILQDMANETNTFKEANTTAPEGVTGVNANGDDEDGEITGVTVDMEYSTDKIVWTPCVGTSITNLAPGTYYVRTKSTTTKKASTPVTIVIGVSLDEDEDVSDDDLG